DLRIEGDRVARLEPGPARMHTRGLERLHRGGLRPTHRVRARLVIVRAPRTGARARVPWGTGEHAAAAAADPPASEVEDTRCAQEDERLGIRSGTGHEVESRSERLTIGRI